MRSIPLAMTWETLRRGRWPLLSALILAGALPAFIINVLRQLGGFDPTHESGIILEFIFMQTNMLALGAAIFFAQGNPSRLYTYPISTVSIVTWHFIPGMLLMALGSVATSVVLNAAFDLGWPAWGPALFGAVAYASLIAVVWLTEKSGWILLGFLVVSFVLGCWNKSRYGSVFSQPDHSWQNVTSTEIASLIGFTVIAFAAAVAGVSRNRYGEPLRSLGILAWIERQYDALAHRERPFSSAARAQLWFEGRIKGWAMPGVVLFAMIVNGLAWLIFNRDVAEIYPGIIAGGGLLTIAGFVAGIAAGHCGSRDSEFSIGSFLATRPLTSAQMARIILTMLAQSILFSWMIWLSVFVVVRGTYFALGSSPPDQISQVIRWWYFPATLIGPWVAAGLIASIGMTGRVKLFLQLFCGLMLTWVASAYFCRLAFSEQQIQQLTVGLTATGGFIFIVATIWIFIAAVRRSLIEPLTAYVAAAFWIVAGIIIAVNWTPNSVVAISQWLFVVGLLALAALPIASAPLALAWNRSR
jgi:hypothetical protein